MAFQTATCGQRRRRLLLTGINGFNLLPVLPLDGGQVLQTILVSRHQALDMVFRVIAALGLLALSIALKTQVFMFFAIGMFVSSVLPAGCAWARSPASSARTDSPRSPPTAKLSPPQPRLRSSPSSTPPARNPSPAKSSPSRPSRFSRLLTPVPGEAGSPASVSCRFTSSAWSPPWSSSWCSWSPSAARSPSSCVQPPTAPSTRSPPPKSASSPTHRSGRAGP